MKSARFSQPDGRGPFRVDQLRPGDPYELSDGHAIAREPAGKRHSRQNLVGGALIDSDPAVEDAGVDAGYALGEATLRAPDVAVGGLDDEAGFAVGAPALAVEYAERGIDERDLQRKIAQLLAAGTQIVWVVRLAGDRLVEVYRPGQAAAMKHSGEELSAPGILQNPVPVDALYDRTVAHDVTLRNLLQRRGYESLEAVRAAAIAEGRAEGALEHTREILLRTLALRGIPLGPDETTAIGSCHDLGTLDLWLGRALVATTSNEVFRSS